MGLQLQISIYGTGEGTKVRAGASRDQDLLGVHHLLSWSAEVAAVGLVSMGIPLRRVCLTLKEEAGTKHIKYRWFRLGENMISAFLSIPCLKIWETGSKKSEVCSAQLGGRGDVWG